MAGLDPAIHLPEPDANGSARDRDFPSARPMLEILFPLDGRPNLVMVLGVNEALQAVPAGKSNDGAGAVLPGASSEIARHAGIEGSVRPVRNYVNPSAAHRAIVDRCGARRNRRVDARVEPGHDR
jgi:hypothetical protein